MNKSTVTIIAEMHTDIKWIKNELEGNGNKGIIQQVMDNTGFKNKIIGGLLVVGSIGVIALLKAFGVF